MRVFSKSTLRKFWERHPDAQQALDEWYKTAVRARWDNPAAVTERFPNASILSNDRVVFRLRGGSYRLVAHINYEHGRVFVRFVGSHSEYERINALEV